MDPERADQHASTRHNVGLPIVNGFIHKYAEPTLTSWPTARLQPSTLTASPSPMPSRIADA
ncbi:MAG: hypothetical protein U0V48_05675 [Anaerolineales bacterium]